jgi:hypothetical protein
VSPELATSIENPQRPWPARPPGAGELARWFAAGSTGLLLVAAVALAWRRLAGALESPLSWQALLLIGFLLCAAAAAVRAAWHSASAPRQEPSPSRRTPRCPTRGDVVAAGLLTASLLAVGGVVSVPGTPPLGLILFWGILAGEELWAWVPRAWLAWPLAPRRNPADSAGASAHRSSARGSPAGLAVDWSEMTSGDVVQQQVRSRAADGTEVLRGWLRVPLAAGQRSASVHVAFCPPFPRTPRVEVEQREGPAARIKSVQSLPHGARFDLKLAQPSETAGFLLLEFSAEEGKET